MDYAKEFYNLAYIYIILMCIRIKWEWTVQAVLMELGRV